MGIFPQAYRTGQAQPWLPPAFEIVEKFQPETRFPQNGLWAVQIGPEGVQKQICVGIREVDAGIDYIRGFIAGAESV